jgi:hypothetical protein
MITKDQVFARHAKVVAAVDLPHVPAGTKGKVLYVAGVTWIRYHVLFENGQGISTLDASQLMALDEWERRDDERRREQRRAERQAALAARTTTERSNDGEATT